MSDPQLRVDPLTGLRTILAPARAGRPDQFRAPAAAEGENEAEEECPFCEGREERTPPELYAVRPGGGEPGTGGWTVRAVPNKYPALAGAGEEAAALRDPLDPAEGRGDPDLFGGGPAAGAHEVIVHAPAHVTSLAELDDERLATAIDAWRERLRAHSGAACRHLIVNEGAVAGASLEHSHAQLYAMPFVPAAIARERERFAAYSTRTMGSCLLCDLAAEEVRRQERLVAIDEQALLLAPWASRSPFELRIVPRRHSPRFEEDGEAGTAMIGTALRLLVGRLGGSPPLNLWVRTAPAGAEHFHWRIDIVPRLAALAGLELGAGLHLNVYPPERAAAELRE